MKKTTLKDLKENLSAITEMVAKGESVEVTKYNRPYIRLLPVTQDGVRIGAAVGKKWPEPATKNDTNGEFLTALIRDRSMESK